MVRLLIINGSLLLTRHVDENVWLWTFHSNDFFPINDYGMIDQDPNSDTYNMIEHFPYVWNGEERTDKNFHFTMETRLVFTYNGGEMFAFDGDDDVLLYINGRLAFDLGGVHGEQQVLLKIDDFVSGSYDYNYGDGPVGWKGYNAEVEDGDAPEGTEFIGMGDSLTFDLFYADRHTTRSNFRMDTTLDLRCIVAGLNQEGGDIYKTSRSK